MVVFGPVSCVFYRSFSGMCMIRSPFLMKQFTHEWNPEGALSRYPQLQVQPRSMKASFAEARTAPLMTQVTCQECGMTVDTLAAASCDVCDAGPFHSDCAEFHVCPPSPSRLRGGQLETHLTKR